MRDRQSPTPKQKIGCRVCHFTCTGVEGTLFPVRRTPIHLSVRAFPTSTTDVETFTIAEDPLRTTRTPKTPELSLRYVDTVRDTKAPRLS